MQIYMARQPIYDGNVQLQAYEILYRAGNTDKANLDTQSPDFGASATARVILNAYDIGIQRVTGNHRAFINLTEELLLADSLELPPEWCVLEVLENIRVTPKIIAAVTRLKSAGYTIALDDFELSDEWRPLLELADIVKVDVMEQGPERTRELLAELRPYQLTLLAEKVETHADFELYRDMGFHLFQGYFFARPKLLRTRTMAANKASVLRLLAALRRPTVEMGEIEALIRPDVALSYRLLRYVNSPHFAVSNRIQSLRQAISMIGVRGLRTWVTLMVLASLDDKPAELLGMALTRARVCELLAKELGADDADAYFTVGLFSLLDAMMDSSLDELVAQLSLSPEIEEALVLGAGDMGRALATVRALEENNVELAEVLDPTPGSRSLAELYLRAITWADDTIASIASSSA